MTGTFGQDLNKREVGPGRRAGSAATVRLKVRYVLAVWGEKYIDRYFESAFPSHLSAGNLPAVAREHDLAFTVLTREVDREVLERHPRYPALRALGPVEVITIDDLLSHPGVFTVTLTLAFTRAMRAAGPAAVDTCFMFMNADFLLADGTLATAARRIADGARAVLAASPRTIAEDVGPRVAALPKDSDGALTLPPRDAVAMALAAPHAMVLAKQPRIGLMHSEQANQYFWFHDEHTLLARSFIMFMLAVRPKRAGYRATSYCDYTLVADLTDPADVSVIDDSDDGFILELQSRTQEIGTVRLGPLTPDAAAAHLAAWTNDHHRDIARHDLVFHSRDLPADLWRTRHEAQDYIDRLLRQLPQPVDQHRHPWWIGGLDAWRFHRPGDPLPAEVAPFPSVNDTSTVGDDGTRAPGSAPVGAVEEPARLGPSPGKLGRVVRRVYDASLPVRSALLAEPARGDLTPLLAGVLSRRNGPGLVVVCGERVPLLRTRFPWRRFRYVDTTRFVPADLGPVERGCRLIVSLSDEMLDRLPAALALADHAARQGAVPAIAIQRRSLSADEFNLALTHALAECHPLHIRRARSMLRESDGFASSRSRFQASLAALREAPDTRRLARTGFDTLRLAGAQLRLRWPGMLRPNLASATIPGGVILLDTSQAERANR